MPLMLVCPSCKTPLLNQDPIACVCGQRYPRLPSGGLDFLQGREFPDFKLDPNDSEQRQVLEQESSGIAWRMEEFALPLIRRYLVASGRHARETTVLDCGCGNGLSIDILNGLGLHAVGVDAGAARHAQWPERRFGSRLHSANALNLPFADGAFDVVLSAGLVEHIGIHEEESREYRARRLDECHSQRQQFVRELVRVLARDGFILIDHPNGAFPADFWHGRPAGSIRWHSPFGDMLPRFGEVRRYFRVADPGLRLHSLSPLHRLRFQKVANRWYGRVFAPLVKTWLVIMNTRGFLFVARSALNPYLVTIATRSREAAGWIRT